MQNVYCHHCGFKLNITSRFCSQCGTSLASLSSKPEPPPPEKIVSNASFKPFSPETNEDDYNKYDHVDHLDINIKGLEIEYTKSDFVSEKLGHIAQTMDSPATERRAFPHNNLSTEKFLREYSQEAGAKPPPSDQ